MPATRASKTKITGHFAAKRNTRSTKRLVTEVAPKKSQNEVQQPSKRAKTPFAPTNQKAPPVHPKTPTIPNYSMFSEGNSVDPSLYSPASSRARTISETSDLDSVVSQQSGVSTKENNFQHVVKTPKMVAKVGGSKTPMGMKNSNPINLTPVTPLKTPSRVSKLGVSTPLKRGREEACKELAYDFSKSPTCAKVGVSALSPLLKRSKCSPRKSESESKPEVPELPQPVLSKTVEIEKVIHADTPIQVKSSKPETLQQRIARIRANAAEKASAKKAATPTVLSSITESTDSPTCSTPKPKTAASSKLAEIKARMAERKNETSNSKSQQSAAFQKVGAMLQKISPKLRISSESRRYMRDSYKDINVDDKVRKLGLPVEYKKSVKQFKNIELSLAQVHNRKQTAIVGRVLRDAMLMNQESTLTGATLKACNGIKEDSWKFDWKRGLRSEGSTNELESSRIKSDNFQMTMKPINLETPTSSEKLAPQTPKTQKPLTNTPKSTPKSPILAAFKHVRMEVQHTQTRLSDFTRRLLVAVYEKHRKFRAAKRNVTEEQEEKEYPLNKLQQWDPEFALNTDVPKISDFGVGVELPQKPGTSGGATPGTPCNSRGLLQKFLKTPARGLKEEFSADLGTPASESTPVTAKPSGLEASPGYKNLPASLLRKYESRRLANISKAVVKTEQKESAELADLKSLYEVARGIKSFYTSNKTTSGLIGQIASNIARTSKSLISDQDAEDKINRLVALDTVKCDKLLEIFKYDGGKEIYVKLGAKVKLADFKVAIDLSVERKERELKLV